MRKVATALILLSCVASTAAFLFPGSGGGSGCGCQPAPACAPVAAPACAPIAAPACAPVPSCGGAGVGGGYAAPAYGGAVGGGQYASAPVYGPQQQSYAPQQSFFPQAGGKAGYVQQPQYQPQQQQYIPQQQSQSFAQPSGGYQQQPQSFAQPAGGYQQQAQAIPPPPPPPDSGASYSQGPAAAAGGKLQEVEDELSNAESTSAAPKTTPAGTPEVIEPVDIKQLKLTNDSECNSEELRTVIIENIDDDLNSSKRLIQLAAEAKFGGRFDVICATNDFSYVTNTELFCQHTKESTSCYAYRQL